LCFAGCAKNSGYPSISAISLSWLELKSEAINAELPSDFESHIEAFLKTLNEFSSSPIGFLYKIHRPEYIQFLADIDSAAKRLSVALKKGGGNELFPVMQEIDSSIGQLQLIEKSLSDASQWNYFFLFFFFCLLIIIVVFALWMLYGRLEKAESRERQSLAFSRETIIAQEQERSRIARELHDTVAQDLWRLSFQTESIDKAAEGAERHRLCTEVAKGQKEIIQRVRSICDNLIPPDFQRRRFDDALRSLCYSFEQRTGIEFQLGIQDKLLKEDIADYLSSDTQLQCFRIVQECLANIEKHSGAAEASVLVHSNDKKELSICVSDNGRGFSPPDRDSCRELRGQGHYGLWSIFERAASISGTVTIDSGAGEGTMVTLLIPFNETSHSLSFGPEEK